MLLSNAAQSAILAGTVTCAFRSWLRPTVKAGGTLNTRIGQLAIDAVTAIEPTQLTTDDATAAGFATVDELRASLRLEPGRTLYRIDFHRAGDDPRLALRADDRLDAERTAELRGRLVRMDARSTDGPWTVRYLRLIAEQPGVVARELAPQVGMERDEFKVRVRRLKGLGLTESLAVGYRLAPRGAALLEKLTADE